MINKFKSTIIYICMLIMSINTYPLIHNHNIKAVIRPVSFHIKYPIRYKGGLEAFLKKMGEIEGHGSYNAVNPYGNLGLYQFDLNTLRGMGFNVTVHEFLSHPSLQDSAMITYMKNNAEDLRTIIKRFSGTYYNGIFITESGILAGAHLAGSDGVVKYFYSTRSTEKLRDVYGTTVSDYMRIFSGYKLRGI